MKTLIAAILLITLDAFSQTDPHRQASEYPTPLIREEMQVTVGGVREIWRLQWKAVPTPFCEPSEDSLSCPCIGFAYGEAGDLVLVRLRNGTDVDELHLTPFFTEDHKAIAQRWPTDDNRDFALSDRDDFAKMVSSRPVVQLMNFADYDHDGNQTEFYLQTYALPCGKSTGVVIGVSRRNPRLHAFSSVSNPGKPLYMLKREWEALRDTSKGPVRVLDWPCGDHGSETQTEIQLNWSSKGIEVVRREYTCPAGNERRRLINEGPQ